MSETFNHWNVVILAAGRGARMRSSLPKVLHPLAGRPMVQYVVDASREAGFGRRVVVSGRETDTVRAALGNAVTCVEQPEPLGTGDALAQAREAVAGAEHLLVLNGDGPLITAETLVRLAQTHEAESASLTLLTAIMEDSAEYGRIVRNGDGRLTAVVEAADCDEGGAGPAEINGGQYCFRADWLWPRLEALPQAKNGEYYLTSLISTAVEEGQVVRPVLAGEPDEVLGINDRAQLARAEAIVRARINEGHMLAGVSIVDPATTYIDATVRIGSDTVIEPNTHLRGGTVVQEGCLLGPNSDLCDAAVGARCRIIASVVEEAALEEEVEVGPNSHLRPGTRLGAGVHIGNFAEVKNATLGRGVKMGHFSYVGDADVGDDANIGAGAVTCNFDGRRKQRTLIGRGAFIGSSTMLVAPVTVGEGARTAAGSVVTKNVPDGKLAAGAPARIVQPQNEESS